MNHAAAAYDFKKSLSRKGFILAGIGTLTVITVLVINHYFYILDAYIYTGEFHLMFITNNLKATKIELFSEYLKPMSLSYALPICLTGMCYSGIGVPSSQIALVSATTEAFGIVTSFLFGLAGFFVLGFLTYGIGTLFLGDIVPFLKRKNYLQYLQTIETPAAIILPLSFAVPLVPIAYAAVGGAFFKVPFKRMSQFMLIGFTIRIFWQLVTK